MSTLFASVAVLVGAFMLPASATARPLVITNTTVIDATGRPAQPNMNVVIENDRIISVKKASVGVPAEAQIIDGKGRYLIPGFVDANVHVTMLPGTESTIGYLDQTETVALNFLQRALRNGVTTVRDSAGVISFEESARDKVNRGEAVGARLLFAGNIIGWTAPRSLSFSRTSDTDLTPWQERFNDLVTLGVGEELTDMTPDEIRVAVGKYIDRGVDFIKYGSNAHFNRPSMLMFSLEQQRAIVETAHARGLPVDTHATSLEGLRYAIEAGVDLIQHADVVTREYPDELIRLIREKKPFCGLFAQVTTGHNWNSFQKYQASIKDLPPPKTMAEGFKRIEQSGPMGDLALKRRNAAKLIQSGCRIVISSDAQVDRPPDFSRSGLAEQALNGDLEAGVATIRAIEGLVELGMTPMQAIIAGTRNGAEAARIEGLGTVEAGKLADLILLDANPLDNIGNIHAISTVIARGKIVDRESLPLEKPW